MKIDGRPERGTELGSKLRDRRVAYSLSLDDAAAVLRIRPAYLDAIETGRLENLPGPAYAVGFVRAYAEYLGLDGEAATNRFKAEAAALKDQTDLKFPDPVDDARTPGPSIVLIGVFMAMIAYGAWYVSTANKKFFVELVSPLPERLAVLLPQSPVETEVVAVIDKAATPNASKTATLDAEDRGRTADPMVQARVNEPTVAVPTPAAAAPVAAAGAATSAGERSPPMVGNPRTTGIGSAALAAASTNGATAPSSRILLKANATSWVEIRDGGGNRIFGRLLDPGDTFAVPDQPGLKMTVGNAGGLDVIVDGTSLPPLGGVGSVRRGIVLDADRLRSAAHSAE